MTNNYLNSSKKRVFDVVLSLFIILILLPFLFISYLFSYFSIGQSFIFKQKRVGKNKKVFTIYKIRTMHNGANQIQKKLISLNQAPYPMFKIKNDPRFTKIGKILSQFGIDEIPQVFNILKGEMSFIGPRPLPINEAQKLDKTWNFRYKFKPGILSYWAISPNRHKSLYEWKKLDKQTVKINSITQEIHIITFAFKTLLIYPLIKK